MGVVEIYHHVTVGEERRHACDFCITEVAQIDIRVKLSRCRSHRERTEIHFTAYIELVFIRRRHCAFQLVKRRLHMNLSVELHRLGSKNELSKFLVGRLEVKALDTSCYNEVRLCTHIIECQHSTFLVQRGAMCRHAVKDHISGEAHRQLLKVRDMIAERLRELNPQREVLFHQGGMQFDKPVGTFTAIFKHADIVLSRYRSIQHHPPSRIEGASDNRRHVKMHITVNVTFLRYHNPVNLRMHRFHVRTFLRKHVVSAFNRVNTLRVIYIKNFRQHYIRRRAARQLKFSTSDADGEVYIVDVILVVGTTCNSQQTCRHHRHKPLRIGNLYSHIRFALVK